MSDYCNSVHHVGMNWYCCYFPAGHDGLCGDNRDSDGVPVRWKADAL